MRFSGAFLILCAAVMAGTLLAWRLPTVKLTVRGPSASVSAATSSSSASAHLVFVGDIQLSRAVGEFLVARNDWAWPFVRIASVTRGAELAFANLESVISDRGKNAGCTYCFRADPRALRGLTAAGFDVLSVANNHVWDFGRDAYTDSLERIGAAGIAAVGGGSTLSEARTPVVRSAGGTRVAYLAYTDLLPSGACAGNGSPGAACYDAVTMAQDITAARNMADLVVVSFHTGTEYEFVHDSRQERIYHAAVDAGADLVIGHHPHVVQDVERYGGGTIFYSLGNFIFDQAWSAPTMLGMLVDVTVRGGAIEHIATRSVDISPQYQASLR